MSKTRKDSGFKQAHRNHVAMGMITAGTGRAQVFRDRRDRRAKDARRKRQDFQEDI